jgi:lipopolysaccharide heptosyltransferase II
MKILIVTKNWIGDVLFQMPAVEAIRVCYPEAEIACVAPKRCREILEANPAVNRVILFDEKKEQRSIWEKLRFVFQLRQERWDQAYLFHRSRTRALLAALGGVKERIGYARGRSWFLTKAVPEPKIPMHHADYFLHLLAETGIPCRLGSPYRFYYSPKAEESARGILQKHHLLPKSFACFHLGANWEPKRWPPLHFAQLAQRIHQRWGLEIAVTGSNRDLSLAEEMKKDVGGFQLISLVEKTSLEELGAVYKDAAFVVTGDSGPMHIASGVGTPVVALFGPTDPNLTGPRGAGDQIVLHYVPQGYRVPWYGKTLPKEGWLSFIQPEEVIKAIEEKGWMEAGDKRQEAGDTKQETRDRKYETRGELESDPDIPTNRGSHLSPVSCLLHQAAKNILVITLSNIGDVIMTTPVIMALISKFPQAKLTAVVGPRAKGVLKGSRFIDRVLVYDKQASLIEQWQFLLRLRRKNYDWVIDLRNTALPYLVNTRKRSPLFRRFHKVNRRDRHLEVLEMTGVKTNGAIPPFDFFRITDEASVLEKLKARGILAEKDWILVAPAAASELKTWRLGGFQEVIERLLAEQNEDILLVGDKREKTIVEPLVSIDPSRVHNLAGATNLPELAALVSRCSLLLANDSAVMHLGYELNRPVVAIFGPTHFEKFGHQVPKFKIVREPVFCSPCERPVCRFERQACFEDLKAEKVFQACKELLEQKSETKCFEIRI